MLRRRWHQESAGVLLGIAPAPPTGADGHLASPAPSDRESRLQSPTLLRQFAQASDGGPVPMRAFVSFSMRLSEHDGLWILIAYAAECRHREAASGMALKWSTMTGRRTRRCLRTMKGTAPELLVGFALLRRWL